MRICAGSVCRSRPPILAARFAITRQAVATAPPAITMQRDPQGPVEYGVSAVSPSTTLILPTSIPRIAWATPTFWKSLPVRVDADPQLQAAVGGEACCGLFVSGDHRNAPAVVHRRAVRRLLAIGRESDADQTSVRLAVFDDLDPGDIDRRDGTAQRSG